MHLGNIYSALLSYLSVKSRGGQWLLRIEDIDPQRSRVAFAEQGMRDLEWLGLEWDNEPVWQSRRSEIYEEHLQRLHEQGLLYPCFCTRADILATQAPHESDGRVVYKGTCRPAPSGEGRESFKSFNGSKSSKSSLRLMVPDETISWTDKHYGPQRINLTSHCGDFVVRRADGAWAYQLAVVVDDALMGVNEVVRGCDLLLSSAQQIYLYRLFGYTAPEFGHLPLLCNEAGQRLSKRDQSLDMGVLRERFTPEELLGVIAHAAGLTQKEQPVSLNELLTLFRWDALPYENITVNRI